MENEMFDIDEFIRRMETYRLPEFNDLPNISLYMEQVVSYISEVLGELNLNNDFSITPFMVNNYVKAKIIEPPIDKKYNRKQVGYLIAISLMKSVVSMKDIATFIDLDKINKSDKDSLYNLFKKMEDEAIQNVIHKVKLRNEIFKKNFKKGKKSNEEENLSELYNLSYIALKLYIDSEANKLIADFIMKKISKEVLPKKIFEDNESLKYVNKKNKIEAKKLADRQK